MQIFKSEVSFLHDVEEETKCEVAKKHKVGNGLHDVPRVIVEGSGRDECKLGEQDRGAKRQDSGGLPRGRLFNGIDLLLSGEHLVM